MAFNTNPGKQSFTATAAQTDFTFNFKIFEVTDLNVYLTPTGSDPDDTTDLLTYGTEYTVAIDGDNGGTITIVTAATADDTVVVERDLPITRTTSYVTNGDLLAATLNADQEYQTYLISDGETVLGRSLVLPSTDVIIDNELPPSAKGGYLKVNPSGTGFEYTDNEFASLTDAEAVSNIISMMALNVTVTTVAIVHGYSLKNDGGGGLFNWDSTIDKTTADAGTIIDPSVSLALQGTGIGLGCWVRQYNGAVNVKWFGAKGDGIIDDTVALTSAFNHGGVISMNPKGIYAISSKLPIATPNTTILLNGCSIVTLPSFSGTGIIEITASNVKISGGASIDGANVDVPTTDFIGGTWEGFGISCRGTFGSPYENIEISDLIIENCPGAAIGLEYINNLTFNSISANSCDNEVTYSGAGVYYLNQCDRSNIKNLKANVFNWKGFGIRNSSGFNVSELIMSNGVSDQAGIFFAGCINFTANALTVTNGFGIKTDDCNGFAIDNASMFLGGIGLIGFMNQGCIGGVVSNMFIRDYTYAGLNQVNHTALDSLITTFTNFTITRGEVGSIAAIVVNGSATQRAGSTIFSSGYIYDCVKGVHVISGAGVLNENLQFKDISIDTFAINGIEGCSREMIIDGIQFLNAGASAKCIRLYNGTSVAVNSCSIINCSTDMLPTTAYFLYGVTGVGTEIKIDVLLINNNSVYGGARVMQIALTQTGDYIRSLVMNGNNTDKSLSATVAILSNAIGTFNTQVCIVGNSLLNNLHVKGSFSFTETAASGVFNGVVENNMLTYVNKPNNV